MLSDRKGMDDSEIELREGYGEEDQFVILSIQAFPLTSNYDLFLKYLLFENQLQIGKNRESEIGIFHLLV